MLHICLPVRRKMKYTTYTEDQLRNAVKISYSLSQVQEALSLTKSGGNSKTIKSHIERLGINIDHFSGKGHLKGKKHNWSKNTPLDELLVEGKFQNTSRLKQRLLNDGILEYKCYMEGCTLTNKWNGKELILRLDHINGDNCDNRKENLRLLCPNCDSQSEFFCGRNKSKNEKKYKYVIKNSIKKRVYDRKPKIPTGKCPICNKNVYGTKHCNQICSHIAQRKNEWPTKEELQKLIDEKSFCAIGRMYNVSDNAVRKWAKNFGIL